MNKYIEFLCNLLNINYLPLRVPSEIYRLQESQKVKKMFKPKLRAEFRKLKKDDTENVSYTFDNSKSEYHVFTDDPEEKEVQRKPQPVYKRLFRK